MLILGKDFFSVCDVYFKHTSIARHSVLEVVTVVLGWLHVPMVGQLWVTSAYGGANELHVSMMFLVRAECVRQRNEVAIKLGIIFLSLSLSRHLLNLQERVVIGFPNFAWAPK